jgi:hypothetical protein
MTTTHWIGTASIVVLNNADIGRYKKVSVDIDLSKVPIDWQNGPPDGSSSPTLDSTFTQGYVVSYVVNYELTGNMYRDAGQQNYLNITTTDFFTNKW